MLEVTLKVTVSLRYHFLCNAHKNYPCLVNELLVQSESVTLHQVNFAVGHGTLVRKNGTDLKTLKF